MHKTVDPREHRGLQTIIRQYQWDQTYNDSIGVQVLRKPFGGGWGILGNLLMMLFPVKTALFHDN